jgi:hypothetical protein
MAAEQALAKLEADNGELPDTVEVITPGHGGRHLYFAYPQDREIRNSASRIAPGVDVRGQGGYVLAPPSIHPNSGLYHWSVDGGKIFAEAPNWLLELAAPTPKSKRHAVPPTPPSEWRELIAGGVSEGARNATITKLAGHLLRRAVDPFLTQELLLAWNAMQCHPPLEEDEIATILRSIAGRELKRRGIT